MRNTIICCHNVEGISRLRPESVPCVITSPPYGSTFDYGGHRWDWDTFTALAAELWRVVEPGGVVVWQVRDQVVNGGYSGTKYQQALHFQKLGFQIFEELHIATHGMMHHSQRHPTQVTMVFVFSKGKPKYIQRIKDRKNVSAGGTFRLNRREPDGSIRIWRSPKERKIPAYGFRTHLWRVATGKYVTTRDDVSDFPGLMPEKLAQDLVLTYSRPGQLVLDPFSGAGTTAKMALLNFRDYLGFEIWEEWHRRSLQRLVKAKKELRRRIERLISA